MTHGTNVAYTIHKCRCDACRLARREYRLKYDQAHRDQIALQHQRWKKKHLAQLRRAEASRRTRDKDKRVAYGREYKERNREALRAKERSPTGKLKRRRITAGRRARQRIQFLEDVDPMVVFEMHGGRCGICGQFVSAQEFEVDHVVPIARGGVHGYVNVQPAHSLCNKRKGACEIHS